MNNEHSFLFISLYNNYIKNYKKNQVGAPLRSAPTLYLS